MLLTPSSLTWEDYIFKSWQVIQSPINNFKWCSTYYCANVSPGIYPRVSGIKSLRREDQCLCDQGCLGFRNSLLIHRPRVTTSFSSPLLPQLLLENLSAGLATGRLGLGVERGHSDVLLAQDVTWATDGFKTIHYKTESHSTRSKALKWSVWLMEKLEERDCGTCGRKSYLAKKRLRPNITLEGQEDGKGLKVAWVRNRDSFLL